MGTSPSATISPPPPNENRLIFVKYDSNYSYVGRVFTTNFVYKFIIRYQRFQWYITKRYSEFVRLDIRLRYEAASSMAKINSPPKAGQFFGTGKPEFLARRGVQLQNYLQEVIDEYGSDVLKCITLKYFLEIGNVSFVYVPLEEQYWSIFLSDFFHPDFFSCRYGQERKRRISTKSNEIKKMFLSNFGKFIVI